MNAKIKVIGVGGGGCNAINTMISDYKIEGVEFVAINTDAQALNNSLAPTKIQIGTQRTGGLGAGGNPAVGAEAAEESAEELRKICEGADLIFVTGGMGGGTGTGAIPIISEIAKNSGALTISIVTKPFAFEMEKRMNIALEGISKLKNATDTMIIIPNQRILEIIDKNITFVQAMKKVDEVLANAVLSIASLVTETGFMNLDFADIKNILKDAGTAMMGVGHSSGEDRAVQAARQAVTSPLLEMSIQGAKGLIFNIQGSEALTMHEVESAASLITEMVDSSAVTKFGTSIDPNLGDELRVTVLAAGFPERPTTSQSQKVSKVIPNSFPDTVEDSKKPDFETKKAVVIDDQTDDDVDIPAFLRR